MNSGLPLLEPPCALNVTMSPGELSRSGSPLTSRSRSLVTAKPGLANADGELVKKPPPSRSLAFAHRTVPPPASRPKPINVRSAPITPRTILPPPGPVVARGSTCGTALMISLTFRGTQLGRIELGPRDRPWTPPTHDGCRAGPAHPTFPARVGDIPALARGTFLSPDLRGIRP